MIALREQIPSDFVSRVSDIFAPGGLMSGAKNFEYRPEQQQMAVAVVPGAAAAHRPFGNDGLQRARGAVEVGQRDVEVFEAARGHDGLSGLR